LVPVVGIELTTYRLQGGCSTTELNRRTFYLIVYCVKELFLDKLLGLLDLPAHPTKQSLEHLLA